MVVRERATMQALADLTDTGFRRYIAQQRRGESPWNPLHPTGASAEELAAVRVPRAAQLLDADVALVICVDLNVVAAFDQDLDRIGLVAGASVYPLVWNILLAARNEGFGGVLTTMVVPEEPAVKELLGIPADFAVAAVLPLGKPVKQVTRLTRKPFSEFVTRERFDGPAF